MTWDAGRSGKVQAAATEVSRSQSMVRPMQVVYLDQLHGGRWTQYPYLYLYRLPVDIQHGSVKATKRPSCLRPFSGDRQ